MFLFAGSGFEQTSLLITKSTNDSSLSPKYVPNCVYFVGKNVHGSCGTGSELISEDSNPTLNSSLSGVSIISIGFGLDPEGGCMCLFGLKEKGKIYSWGYNEFGEMGTGKTSQEPQT
jgi:alpha-tubulin suppressor-like RCC1 family protein